jgi:hypothetical protein
MGAGRGCDKCGHFAHESRCEVEGCGCEKTFRWEPDTWKTLAETARILEVAHDVAIDESTANHTAITGECWCSIGHAVMRIEMVLGLRDEYGEAI